MEAIATESIAVTQAEETGATPATSQSGLALLVVPLFTGAAKGGEI